MTLRRFMGLALVAQLIGALMATPVVVLAQGSAPPPTQSAPGDSNSVEDQLKQLTTALTLTPAQQTNARSILTERQSQILAVRAAFPAPRPGAAPPPDGPVKMRAVMQAAHSKMLSILTPAQRALYDKLDTTGMGPPPPTP